MSFGSWSTNQRTGRRGLPPPGVPRPQSPNALRIDPNDGLPYTYAELLDFYGSQTDEIEVVRWWNSLQRLTPKRARRRPSRDPPPTGPGRSINGQRKILTNYG